MPPFVESNPSSDGSTFATTSALNGKIEKPAFVAITDSSGRPR
jgi:hypothetical protein